MNYLKRVSKMTNEHFKFYKQPRFQNPSLVVGWSEDAGKLGPKVIDFLNKELGAEKFCEIEPSDFFPLGGVAIKHDLVQFPESKFYSCENNNLVIFTSDAPSYEWHKFLNTVLDVAEYHCGVKELYTIGGIVSLTAHTNPRRISTVVNQPELKRMLAGHGLDTDMNYQTPPGGRPTLSSFLLWVAKRRNIGGANLWVEVPFYLAAGEDLKAWKTMVEFFDKRFSLSIDLEEINQENKNQEGKIKQMRMENPEIDEYIGKLESGGKLTSDESEKLVKTIDNLLKKRG